MRTKVEILRNAKTDIVNSKASFPTSYWLRYRELEVLCDIRDILDNRLLEIDRDIHKILDILRK